MKPVSVRWRNFRGFEDTGRLEIRPITIILGANATGKTSIVAPLLLLKQTLESSDRELALNTKGEYFNAGSYENLIFAHDSERVLSFMFGLTEVKKGEKEKLKPIGGYPPGEVEFSFSAGEGRSTRLKRYEVWDIYGRRILVRSRLRSGKYSVGGLKLPSKGRGLHTFIRRSLPERFLFTSEGPFREAVVDVVDEVRKHRKSSEEKIERFELSLQDAEALYMQAVSFTAGRVEELLESVAYIGPLREHPHRLYEVSGERPTSVGIRGEYAPEILFRERHTGLLDQVNAWVSKFEFGYRLKCNELSEGVFNITFARTLKSPAINLADTGFGVSQVLPLIVQGLYGDSDSLLIAEQPEIHLNPKLQALLADLFCEFVARRVSVLVETHSEHLLLRIRRLIAEGKIKATDVALYYVEREKDRSLIREIVLQKNGHIELEAWPKGFFGEALRESLGLASAQAKRDGHA